MKQCITLVSIAFILIYYLASLFLLLGGHKLLIPSNSFVSNLLTVAGRDKVDGKTILLPSQTEKIEYFFKKDPEIFGILCAYFSEKNDSAALTICQNAFLFDPQNAVPLRSYLKVVFDLQPQSKVAETLSSLHSQNVYSPLPFNDPNVIKLLTPSFFKSLPTQATTVPEFLSQFYYSIGLDLLPTDPNITLQFWTEAKDLSPGWGYFHEELASVEYYSFGKKDKARIILENCQYYESAKDQCSQAIEMIHPPGYFKQYIIDIPSVTKIDIKDFIKKQF
jgi:hypothetical protein